MTNRQFAVATLAFLAAGLVSVWVIDQPLAYFVDRNLRGVEFAFAALTEYAEIASGYRLSRWLPGFLLLGAGGVLYLVRWNIPVAKILGFAGTAFLLTRLTAGVLKTVFERTRPFDLVKSNDYVQTFFIDGGSSFPSGHAAHFWGLFLPLIFLFPKYRAALFIVPAFIFVARVAVNDHYLSDVLASTYIALFFTFFLAKTMKMAPARMA